MADEYRSGPGDSYITRREWDMLCAELHETRAWVERVDTHGTRNAGVTETRIIDAAADIGELKAELRAHLADHKRLAEQAEKDRAAAAKDRASRRRWVIGSVFAALGALSGYLTLLYEIMRHTTGH